jgi:hypothetical protein
MKKITLGILITFSLAALCLHIKPMYVQPGVAKVASPRIKKAMQKMGPMKNYRILTDGRLQVMVNSQWLYLKY